MNDARDEAQFRIVLQRHLTRAGNAVDLAVANGLTTLAYTLPLTEQDALYGVKITPSWNTTFWVTGKTTTGFTIHFGSAAGADATVDVDTFRSA